MSAIVELINDTIEAWNRNVSEIGRNFKLELRVDVCDKKFYINRIDFYEKRVAELFLFKKAIDHTETSYLLYHTYLHILPKDIKRNINRIKIEYIDTLYRSLMYEALGSFSVICEQAIEAQDSAEWDIENNRLKQHDSAKEMIVRTIHPGPFYESGNEFDVFLNDEDSEFYNVYTCHEMGAKNGGVTPIRKDNCMIVQAAKKSVILLNKV